MVSRAATWALLLVLPWCVLGDEEWCESSISCALSCDYGLAQDEYGCTFCTCYDPCQDKSCPVDRPCKVVDGTPLCGDGNVLFVDRPEDKSVHEGESFSFKCTTDDDDATIQWFRNGQMLMNDPHAHSNPTCTVLTIQNVVKADHEGEYECVARGVWGEIRVSAWVKVIPAVAPTITKISADQKVKVGYPAVLTCISEGYPAPDVQWFKDTIRVVSNDQVTFYENGRLLIKRVSIQDDGQYECLASNIAGKDKKTTNLDVVDSRLSSNYTEPSILRTLVKKFKFVVDRAVNNTLDEQHATKHLSPFDKLRKTRFPNNAHVRRQFKAAETMELVMEFIKNSTTDTDDTLSFSDLLSPFKLRLIASLAGCEKEEDDHASCDDDIRFHLKYRTLDGTCNNLKHPSWGASDIALNRLLPADYKNKFNVPKGAYGQVNGFKLPSARTLSVELLSTPTIHDDVKFTGMLMQFGQISDHDFGLSPLAISNTRFGDGRFCNETCDYKAPCFPIQVHSGDPRIKSDCIPFTRSAAVCSITRNKKSKQSIVTSREQINELTSYIDASQIYGSTDEAAENLRDLETNKGLLRNGGLYKNGKELLPPNNGEEIDCQLDDSADNIPCYQAGDIRANEQLGLLATHTLFFREHNRIARKLAELNPEWDGDKLYHEARKIVAAELQHILFSTFLPYILNGKSLQKLGPYTGYNPKVDATALNEFTTSAFRFGHTIINPILFRLNSTYQPIPEGNLRLSQAFFAPNRYINEGGMDPLIRGLITKPGKMNRPDEPITNELTEKLFAHAHETALDLAALNIQRGRDHGLRSYNDYREYCGLGRAETFDDLKTEITNAELRTKLEKLYGTTDNIDMIVGSLLEDSTDGGRVGPTSSCIIVEQMKRFREGDRFWYENPDVFKPAQLVEIRETTLARIICDNSDGIKQIQPDVFAIPDLESDIGDCDDLPFVDLRLWTQCDGDSNTIPHATVEPTLSYRDYYESD